MLITGLNDQGLSCYLDNKVWIEIALCNSIVTFKKNFLYTKKDQAHWHVFVTSYDNMTSGGIIFFWDFALCPLDSNICNDLLKKISSSLENM